MFASMHRRTMMTAAALMLVTAAGTVSLVSPAAAAPCRGTFCPDQGTGGQKSGAQSYVVWSSLVRYQYKNMPAGGTGAPARRVSAPYFPCGYWPMYTGYRFANEVWMKPEYMRHDDDGETPTRWPPEAEKDAHAQDMGEGGMWHVPYCILEQEGYDTFGEAGLDKIVREWFAKAEDYLWVATGTQPPVPPITVPPEVLAVLAYGELRIPDLHLHRSPAVGRPTYVNYNTWFWVDQGDLLGPIAVTAVAGANSATVEVRTDALTIKATDSPRVVTCTAAQARAQGACIRVFAKSSAGLAGLVHQVTATARWTPTFAIVPAVPVPANLDDPVDVTAGMPVPVAEIQSVVEDAR